MSEPKKSSKCEDCKKTFEQSTGRGRPRKFCKTCRLARVKK